MRSVDRRTFLKRIGALSAATATAAALPAVAAGPDLTSRGGPRWRKAPCRLCGVGCGLLIGLEGGRAVAVRGDPDSPVSAGLACVKGYHAVEALHGSDRFTRALLRQNGGLAPVSLPAALDQVASAIQETIRRYGPDSVALYGSAQWTIPDAYVASKLFKGALGTNNVESSTRLHAGGVISGLERTFGLDGAIGCYDDIEHADTLVLWDVNLAETDPVLFSRMLERRRRSPAVRIIDLTTRTTRTSYAADQSLLFALGMAAAVAAGICHELVAGRLVRSDFVERFVAFKRESAAGQGIADATWGEYVGSLDGYGARRVEELSGLSVSNLRWLASVYGDPTRNVVSVWNPGLGRAGGGAWVHHLLYTIHLLVGKVASPGNGPLCLSGQPNGGSSVHDAGTLAHTLPRGRVDSEDDRRRAGRIWGVPYERLSQRPGRSGLAMFDALERGDIRFLWIQATNPMVSLPDLARYRRAAGRDDRFIVVNEAYPTPTSDVADVVLPAAMWFEREGLYANVERRIQHFAALVPPPGDATSDAWLMIEVARRLGHGKLFPWDARTHVEQIWAEYSRFHDDSATALPPLGALRAERGIQWPHVGGQSVQRRYNAAHDPHAEPGRGGYDFYGHPDHRAWVWLGLPEVGRATRDPAFPLRLVTGPVLEHWGGGAMTQRVAVLHHALPHAYLELNREDAKEIGIQNREMVRVSSRSGSLEIEARIEYRSQPPRGQVFVPTFDEKHPVNRLFAAFSDPVSGEAIGVCAVRVERVSTRSGG